MNIVSNIKLEKSDLKIRFNFNFEKGTYIVSKVDLKTDKATPISTSMPIPSYLKDANLYVSLVAYSGSETIGSIQIYEITVSENLNQLVRNFDKDLDKLNRKMVNDLIHSHSMDTKNKSLLTVMINEEDLTRDTIKAKKLATMILQNLDEKMFKKSSLHKATQNDPLYIEASDSMIKGLKAMLDNQKKLQDKIGESNRIADAFNKLENLLSDLEYIEKFVDQFDIRLRTSKH